MLNLAGPSYDFGDVLFAVLQECEHWRRGLLPNEARGAPAGDGAPQARGDPRSYEERGGTRPYWTIWSARCSDPAAAVRPRRRRADAARNEPLRPLAAGRPAARALFALLGLVLGGLIIAAPLFLSSRTLRLPAHAGGAPLPGDQEGVFDFRHAQPLNLPLKQWERYQREPAGALRHGSRAGGGSWSGGGTPARDAASPAPFDRRACAGRGRLKTRRCADDDSGRATAGRPYTPSGGGLV